MAGITGDIKGLLSFKYKERSDSLTDQYNRVFMVKFMLVAAFVTGFKWYKDEFKCIIPNTAGIDGGFVASACWINGFYVYKELKEIPNFYGYYGIPNDISHNGSRMTAVGEVIPCVATPYSTCQKYEKVFYLQYQWFPFYIAVLAILFYIPYLIHQKVNEDIFSLKKDIEKLDANPDDILHNYFVEEVNTSTRQRVKIVLNVIIKILYLIANVLTFHFTDSILNGDFRKYGSNWLKWTSMDNYNMYNYIGWREFFKAGEVILPNFGMCDVLQIGQDDINDLNNDLKFICEISPHVLYQYVLGILWIMLIIGIVVSLVGIILSLVTHVMRLAMFTKNEAALKLAYNSLSLRQREYLDYIQKKNFALYGKLITVLSNKH